MQNFGDLLGHIQQLFEQFSFSRLFSLIVLVVLIIMGLFVWDWTTGYLYYGSLDRKISILERLHELERTGITDNPELKQLYEDSVEDLTRHKVHPISTIPSEMRSSEGFFKFLSSGWLGWLMIIVGFSEKRKGKGDWKNTVVAGIFFGIMMGLVGYILPTLGSIWVNYLVWPFLLQLILLYVLVKYLPKARNLIQSDKSR